MIGPYPLDSIITGDARELAKAIPDESIDLIFTDPPYLREFLPLYEWLASEAARILKPTGFLMVYAGNVWKGEIYRYLLRSPLEYFWDYTMKYAGMGSIVWKTRTVARSKSILAFRKGSGMPRCNVLGLWDGNGSDKRYHDWGQDESTARYYIDCFTDDSQVILDPFVGGGTTAAVCKILKRRYLAFEIDPDTAARARARVVSMQMPLFTVPSVQAPLFAAGGSGDD